MSVIAASAFLNHEAWDGVSTRSASPRFRFFEDFDSFDELPAELKLASERPPLVSFSKSRGRDVASLCS